MADIRKPTAKQEETLEQSRRLYQKGIEGEKDMLSKISTTMAKSARDDIRAAKKMRESVPESVREYEAYQGAGYKKGGKVKKLAYGGHLFKRMGKGSYMDNFVAPMDEEAKKRLGMTGMKKGGKVNSASKRADGCAKKGKTKGRMI
jgi:hypothetical protein